LSQACLEGSWSNLLKVQDSEENHQERWDHESLTELECIGCGIACRGDLMLPLIKTDDADDVSIHELISFGWLTLVGSF